MTLPPRTRIVNGKGPRGAKIAIVGEQPGKDEVRFGAPFIGPAGQELDRILTSANIARRECYITNVIKDLEFPLAHYFELGKGGATVTRDFNDYTQYLRDELTYVNPNVVVAVGNVGLFALTTRTGVTKWRGSILGSTLISGLKVIPTIHPATILPPKNVYLNKHLITFDFVKAKRESEFKEISSLPLTLTIQPSYSQAISYLGYALEEGRTGNVIDFDIEVVQEELFCFSVAVDRNTSMSIPLVHGADYFTIDQEREILLAFARIIEDPTITKRGQNLCFDLAFLFKKYGIKPRGWIHDTMIAQKISLPDYPMGLDFICSIHTDIPYYKNEGKKYLRVGGEIIKFWEYSALDAVATANAHPTQIEELTKAGNLSTYERHCKLIPILTFMQERGIRFDVNGMLKGRTETEAKIKEKEHELATLVGSELNYNSPKQVADYFYTTKGITPYTKPSTKGRVQTCDADALKRIARGTATRAGLREAKLIMELRTLTTKHLGTYLSIDKIDKDGRYRSQYNPVGTVTGRLSSSENIFGTGGNQQNWPHELLKYLRADEGYVCYSIDLSQAENRIVAYVGRVLEMIEAFESGLDLHRLTAGLLFNKSPAEISDEDGSSTIGDGTQSERYWGKKANHSLNYDISYVEFGLKNEIPEYQAKWIIEQYHRAYPGVRQGYHELIKMQLSKGRVVENLMGRKRVFLERWGRDLFKEAYAHIPQSTVADVINERGLIFIWENQDIFKEVELLRQVHDDIGFQIPTTISFTQHAWILDRIVKSLETPLVFHNREFVIPADITMGLSFTKEKGRCFEIKAKNRPKTTLEMAGMLSTAYTKLKEKENE